MLLTALGRCTHPSHTDADRALTKRASLGRALVGQAVTYWAPSTTGVHDPLQTQLPDYRARCREVTSW